MREITIIQTNDGKRFDTEQQANRHLENNYADLLLKITHKLTDYAKLAEVIDTNLEKFVELADIKKEIANFKKGE